MFLSQSLNLNLPSKGNRSYFLFGNPSYIFTSFENTKCINKLWYLFASRLLQTYKTLLFNNNNEQQQPYLVSNFGPLLYRRVLHVHV